MQIHIHKNGQKLGPYLPEEARTRFEAGEFSGSDLAWHEGLPTWQPLAQILSSTPGASAPLPKSGFAKAAFITAIVSVVTWFVILAAAGIAYSSGRGSRNPLMVVIGLLVFANMGFNLIGIIFGLVAFRKPSANKWMAITGLVLHAVQLVMILVILAFGLSRKSTRARAADATMDRPQLSQSYS